VTQDERTWAFGYALGLRDGGNGDTINAGSCPLFGPEARLVHHRLRDASHVQSPATRVPPGEVIAENPTP
jgi:hypothetical protein